MSMDSELKARIITALLGLPIILGLLVYGSFWGTWVIASVVSFLMWIEYSGLIYRLKDKTNKRFFALSLCVFSFLAFTLHPAYTLLITALIFSCLCIFFVLITKNHLDEDIPQHVHELSYSLFGVLYLTICPIFLPLLRGLDVGVHLVLLFLFINWSNDVAAYFIGKRFGKNKLYPQISPKKSWEGAIAGLVFSLIMTLGYSYLVDFGLTALELIITSLMVCIFAQIGDLLESLIKRSFHVKDSGSILPGHGGVLDRFDGILLSAPAMYLCIAAFNSF